MWSIPVHIDPNQFYPWVYDSVYLYNIPENIVQAIRRCDEGQTIASSNAIRKI